MSRTANNIRIPLKEETAIRAFFRVKPTNDMPRPGANRPKSIVAEMNAEYGPIMARKKARAKKT